MAPNTTTPPNPLGAHTPKAWGRFWRSPAEGLVNLAVVRFWTAAGHRRRRPPHRRHRPGGLPAVARRDRAVGQPAHDHPARPQPADPIASTKWVDRRTAPSRLAHHARGRPAKGLLEDRRPCGARPAGRGLHERASARPEPE